jgi:glycosyltransferase involved in cell wall biosynthesis
MSDEPTISVIIPTYNRVFNLKRTLDALSLQSCPFCDFEVIVISDGCTDETSSALRSYDGPCTLHLIEQGNEGVAAARNHGAEYAKARVLLFIDDDVEPMPSLVEGHARAHQGKRHQVVIGPYPSAAQFDLDFAGLESRAWWDQIFNSMSSPGHRFRFTDLVGGNFSIDADLFKRVGRFDPTFSCHEDSELGIRLIKSDADFTFAPEASACHHEDRSVSRSFNRKREEGKTDVRIARLYPELLSVLPVGYYAGAGCRLSRVLRTLAFISRQVGDGLASSLQLGLKLMEEAKLRDSWKQLWDVLKDYWYWRGVAEELTDRRALADLGQLADGSLASEHLEIEIDLREGIDKAERLLDDQRPAALRLFYGMQPVGVVPFTPGAERLKGVHLRSILTSSLAAPMLAALTLAGVTTDSDSINREKLAFLLQFKSSWFGKMETRKHWSEQYSQWLSLKGRYQEGDSLYWRQQTEIANLKNEKLILDSQYAHWQRLAERHEQDITRQQEIIENLEGEKKSLEREWQRVQPVLERDPLHS